MPRHVSETQPGRWTGLLEAGDDFDADFRPPDQPAPGQPTMGQPSTVTPPDPALEGAVYTPGHSGDIPETDTGTTPPAQPVGEDDDMEVAPPARPEAAADDPDFLEATPEQLAVPPGPQTAVQDLLETGEFEPVIEAGEVLPPGLLLEPLPEVGESLPGTLDPHQEEFGFLAAVLPTLISRVGKPIGKLIFNKLRARIQARLRRRAARAKAARARRAAARRAGQESGLELTPTVGERATPTREAMLSLIAEFLEEAAADPTPATEAVTENDDAFATEVATVLEVILGKDDRVRIQRTRTTHWRLICALRITFPNGRVFRGTGFLISRQVVATAGHCVYMKSQGGWARKIEVIPGANGREQPYGSVESNRFRSVAGWVRNEKPDSDYGCIVLPSGAFAGRNLGYFGLAAMDAARMRAVPAVLAGYPGDKPFAELWGMSRKIKSISDRMLTYDIDTVGGQSGAPVYVTIGGRRYVIGVHRGGHQSGNSAARITSAVHARLTAWARLT